MKKLTDKLSVSRADLLAGLAVTGFFLATRLTNLRLWPIFTDEAIYLRWSQIGLNDAAFRFISLTDGKQPLWHWFTMLALKFIEDPLIAGRLVSVAAGFVALIGVWLLAYRLFERKSVAWLAAGFYLIVPSALLYDRMALVESMLTLFIIWTLFFAVSTAKRLRFDLAMLTGFTLGGGLLTKSPAIFLEFLYPLHLIFLSGKKQIFRWLTLLVPTLVIAEGMRNLMRLSPWMHMIALKNSEFVIGFAELFRDPFRWFWGNLPSLWHWWVGSLTWPVMLTVGLALLFVLLPLGHALSLRLKTREVVYLTAFSLIPFLASAALGKVIFARYLLFISPPLLILAAAAADRIFSLVKTPPPRFVYLMFLTLPALYLDFKIITDPLNAPVIESDKNQYLNGHSAGWGVDAVIAYLRMEALKGPVFLGTQGTFGLMPASFELYLWDNPNIQIRGYWPVSAVPAEVVEIAAEKPTFFIYYESKWEEIPPQENLELLEKFKKGESERYMYFFRVLPESGQ